MQPDAGNVQWAPLLSSAAYVLAYHPESRDHNKLDLYIQQKLKSFISMSASQESKYRVLVWNAHKSKRPDAMESDFIKLMMDAAVKFGCNLAKHGQALDKAALDLFTLVMSTMVKATFEQGWDARSAICAAYNAHQAEVRAFATVSSTPQQPRSSPHVSAPRRGSPTASLSSVPRSGSPASAPAARSAHASRTRILLPQAVRTDSKSTASSHRTIRGFAVNRGMPQQSPPGAGAGARTLTSNALPASALTSAHASMGAEIVRGEGKSRAMDALRQLQGKVHKPPRR